MKEKIFNGLPTLSLMPLTEAQFKVVDKINIIIPRSGVYEDIQPKVFSEKDGAFNILNDDIIYLPSITKVLLATNKYPVLKQNQVFTPLYFEFTEDEVQIQGSILEIIKVKGV